MYTHRNKVVDMNTSAAQIFITTVEKLKNLAVISLKVFDFN